MAMFGTPLRRESLLFFLHTLVCLLLNLLVSICS